MKLEPCEARSFLLCYPPLTHTSQLSFLYSVISDAFLPSLKYDAFFVNPNSYVPCHVSQFLSSHFTLRFPGWVLESNYPLWVFKSFRRDSDGGEFMWHVHSELDLITTGPWVSKSNLKKKKTGPTAEPFPSAYMLR